MGPRNVLNKTIPNKNTIANHSDSNNPGFLDLNSKSMTPFVDVSTDHITKETNPQEPGNSLHEMRKPTVIELSSMEQGLPVISDKPVDQALHQVQMNASKIPQSNATNLGDVATFVDDVPKTILDANLASRVDEDNMSLLETV